MLVFPKCFLESEYSIGKTSDRGIRKYKTATDGMYFLYEPNWFVRQFIKQYDVKGNLIKAETVTIPRHRPLASISLFWITNW